MGHSEKTDSLPFRYSRAGPRKTLSYGRRIVDEREEPPESREEVRPVLFDDLRLLEPADRPETKPVPNETVFNYLPLEQNLPRILYPFAPEDTSNFPSSPPACAWTHSRNAPTVSVGSPSVRT